MHEACSGEGETEEWLRSSVRYWESFPGFSIPGRYWLPLDLQIASNLFPFSLRKLVNTKYFPSHRLHLDTIFPFLALALLGGTKTVSGLGWVLNTHHMLSIKREWPVPWLCYKRQSHNWLVNFIIGAVSEELPCILPVPIPSNAMLQFEQQCGFEIRLQIQLKPRNTRQQGWSGPWKRQVMQEWSSVRYIFSGGWFSAMLSYHFSAYIRDVRPYCKPKVLKSEKAKENGGQRWMVRFCK